MKWKNIEKILNYKLFISQFKRKFANQNSVRLKKKKCSAAILSEKFQIIISRHEHSKERARKKTARN